MGDPADITITRGNNYPPAKWQFLESENPDVLFNLAGSVLKLRVDWPGGSLTRTTGIDPDLVIDLVNSMLTWNYSVAQSRLMPLGRVANYELERWISSTQQTLIDGYFIVEVGTNPD